MVRNIDKNIDRKITAIKNQYTYRYQDGQIGRQIDGQKYRQENKKTCRYIDRQIDI